MSNATGLCECGCGERTPLATQNHSLKGYVKGQAIRFINGHGTRGRKATPEQSEYLSRIRRGHIVTQATRAKFSLANKGDQNPNWRGGLTSTGRGYRGVLASGHPRANTDGYVLEHVLVIEAKLGRALMAGEIVHHIDGNKLNNHPDNLMAFASRGEHARFHKMAASDPEPLSPGRCS